ncbi:MAG TPA: ferritin-like domain-containing protein [Candidatus Acidoferrales bacterium]|nr:ferritin-like domain-containing protein [Candidatus Acidoferrales bacterium]
MATFTKDIEEIRQRAMQKIEEGAVTENYGLDLDRVISVLNEALATEIVCVLRYTHHYFMATGVHGRSVASEFKEHADEERQHADMIGERIQQLGGKPDFNPGTLLQRSVAQYVEGETLGDMIREDLVAERTVIEVYQRMIEFFGAKDPTTRRMLEHVKSQEEEHASDLSDMLFIVDPHSGQERGVDPGTDPLHMRGAQRGQQSAQGPEQTRVRLEGESEPPARNIGGVGGRPMNRRSSAEDQDETERTEDVNEGAMTGTNRSPKIMEKNRKRRIA